MSPVSSVPSTSDGQEMSADGAHDERGKVDHDGNDQVFHQGLPVEQQ